MKLGPSKGGTAVPALVAALAVLGAGVALAGRSGPEPVPARPSRTLGPISPSGSSMGAAGSHGPRSPGPAITEGGCERAIRDGRAALEGSRTLDRAIREVSENCSRNPQASGLLRALERLRRNQERQEGTDPGEPQARRGRHGTDEERSRRGGAPRVGDSGRARSVRAEHGRGSPPAR